MRSEQKSSGSPDSDDPSQKVAGYVVPDWFGDAKFGIWSHWGPQSAVGFGDWYARRMYLEGSPQYAYHVRRFGHPSELGYKDTIPLFTAAEWDPDGLMDLYARAGAKYFFSMGVHHDNFDMWNSKHQPRWNAVASGPKRDIVGEWAAAARKRGLRFGVSEHLSNSFAWYAPAHLADTTGPYKNVPYDGANLANADLYHDYSEEPGDYATLHAATPHAGMSREAPEWWKKQYHQRIIDLIDQHQPDMLYTDGGVPFGQYGWDIVKHLHQLGLRSARGQAETVYFSKVLQDCLGGSCVLDRERGVADDIEALPWQTDTCIGAWHYKEGAKYKSAKKVIDMLVDIVSKNGNLLLNFPLPASGRLDSEEMNVLAGITEWMRTNGEGIFSTRPWRVFGEGPGTQSRTSDAKFNEGSQPPLTGKDIRFTSKGQTIYAFIQGWPGPRLDITSLGTAAATAAPKIIDARVLGEEQPLSFVQGSQALNIDLPARVERVASIGFTIRLRFS